MLKIRNYRIGFDAWGLILFIVIMIPNIIWFIVPAADDPLRNESVTPIIDNIAQVFQIVMVAALCIFKNKSAKIPMDKLFKISIIAFIAVYFGGWIAYYAGVVSAFIHLILCIAPCLAFITYSVARKNLLSLVTACAFMICHVIYGVINFVI